MLSAQPTGNVVISVTRRGSGDVTVSPTSLTFTPFNWNTAQTVAVTVVQDDDAVNDMATITHSVVDDMSADEFDAAPDVPLPLTVIDDDGGVTVSTTTLPVDEGANATYTVVLDGSPASDVVIAVSSSGDVTVDTDAVTTGNQSTLTFTPSNWDTAQTVTVTAAEDTDGTDDIVAITHTVVPSDSADEFDLVRVANVTVTVTDDDYGVTVSARTLTVAEGGSATYTVVLAAEPSGSVVLSVTKGGSDDVTVDTTLLTFTTSNWSMAQTVTVTAAQDADAADDTAIITHTVVPSSSAAEYNLVLVADVRVTVNDNETAGVTVSGATLTVAEGGSATYTVVLDAEPTGSVVITVNSDNSDVTLSAATLTFTTANWSTAQTVTVRAAQDADTATITHAVEASSSADEYDSVVAAGVTVTVADEDPGVSVSATSPLALAEGDSTTYMVVLYEAPTSGEVVISVTVTGSSDVTVDTARLTFTTSNWSTPKTVTVSAAQDADTVDDAASITHAVVAASSADEFDAAPNIVLPVTVTDDDAAGVTVSATDVKANEGSTATSTVVLDAQPASNVVITVTAGGDSDVTVSPTRLTFTTSNWNVGQRVTVSAAQDVDSANDTASITHAVVDASSANEYDGVVVAGVSVTVTDDVSPPPVDRNPPTVDPSPPPAGPSPPPVDRSPPTAGPSPPPAGPSPPTAGGSPPDRNPTFASRTVDDQIYTVGENVGTVGLPAARQGDGTLRYSLSPDLPERLRFNSNRTITGTPRATFPRTRFTYTATDSDGDPVHLRFYITVNERPGVTVSPTEVTVAEGSSAIYTVVLDARPASDVVIDVTAGGSPDVTVDTDGATSGNRNTLTFTRANWDRAQTVTLSAAHDADAVNDAASISHAVDASRSAHEYDVVTIAGVAVTITDDDTTERSVAENTGEGVGVGEGDPGAAKSPDGGPLTYALGGTNAALFTIDADTGQDQGRHRDGAGLRGGQERLRGYSHRHGLIGPKHESRGDHQSNRRGLGSLRRE